MIFDMGGFFQWMCRDNPSILPKQVGIGKHAAIN